MRSLLPLLLVVALHPDTALCQGSSSPLARADIAASIGSFSAKRAERAGIRPTGLTAWSAASAAAITGATISRPRSTSRRARRAEAYGSESAGVPGSPLSNIFLEHAYQSVAVSVGQSYQFGRNALFHPFVAAGVDVERRRHEIERPAQSVPIYARNPLNPQIVQASPVRSRFRR